MCDDIEDAVVYYTKENGVFQTCLGFNLEITEIKK
jgi:hypothetical protein